MIQSIKTEVTVGDGPEKQLSFDYSEIDDMVWIYLDSKYICTMSFEGNFKEVVNKIIEKW